MKVSTDSWHCRAVSFATEGPSSNLCRYFWQLVWACIGLPIVAVLMAALVSMPLWWWLTPERDGLVVIAVIIGAGEIWALGYFWREYRNELRYVGKLPPKPARQPSVIAAWMRAKKEKICPILEFE